MIQVTLNHRLREPFMCPSQVLVLSQPSLFSFKYENHFRRVVPDEKLRNPLQLVSIMLISQEKLSFLFFFLEPKDLYFVISCGHLFLFSFSPSLAHFMALCHLVPLLQTPSPLLFPPCAQCPTLHPLYMSFYNLSSLDSCL